MRTAERPTSDDGLVWFDVASDGVDFGDFDGFWFG